jgi:SpoVK/Ycf46/Vps4 family AAA+-type ATPase
MTRSGVLDVASVEEKNESPSRGNDFIPYHSELAHMQDELERLLLRIRINRRIPDKLPNRTCKFEELNEADEQWQKIRTGLEERERSYKTRIAGRLRLTREAGLVPRFEQLAEARGFEDFERDVVLLLVGANVHSFYRDLLGSSPTIEEILESIGGNLEERILSRRYFYKSGRLVIDGIINVDSDHGRFHRSTVSLDRRMMDWLLGLDTELNEMVEGSHLYTPTVKLENVILPDVQKGTIMKAVVNFEHFTRARKRVGLDEVISYGRGIVLLFFGLSGTGKTMMVNAIANNVGKQVLLIDSSSLGHRLEESFRLIFREAKINNAILFFDECEGLLGDRRHNSAASILLTELERFDGIIILATNRPQAIDEAMHRRITMAFPFRRPDYQLRRRIWETHLPMKEALSPDVDIDFLAFNFELTGGLIKNAILSALSFAVERDKEEVVIIQDDLLRGARLQLRGFFQSEEFECNIVPSAGLDKFVGSEGMVGQLREIVAMEKAKGVLFGQWCFSGNGHQFRKGTSVLFYGPPGTGKSYAAEVLSFELGKPLRIVSSAELNSKWVGETEKNIERLFRDADDGEHILFFDEADSLFTNRTGVQNSTDRYGNADVNTLLRRLERSRSMVILATNLKDNLDPALMRRFTYVVKFEHPGVEERERLWVSILPKLAPRDETIDFRMLADRFPLAGGHIKNAIFKAAARAAMRCNGEQVLRAEDLAQAAEEELREQRERPIGFRTR